MPRHLISDTHEWVNEVPTVPFFHKLSISIQNFMEILKMSKLLKKMHFLKQEFKMIFFQKVNTEFHCDSSNVKISKKMNFFTRNKKKANSLCGKEPTMHHGVNGSNPAWLL